MFIRLRILRSTLGILAAALLAACAQHGAMLPPTSLAPMLPLALPDAVPPKCKGQKTTKNYASLSVKLSTKGGSFCIPAIGGFGGTVKYPGADPSVKLKITSSVKNYDKMPELGSGKAIFYMQLAISGGTSFGSGGTAGGGLESKTIEKGKTYTAFGQATIFSFPVDFTPCYVTATSGKYGGVIGGIGTLLKGQSVPAKATGVIELYPGKQASGKC